MKKYIVIIGLFLYCFPLSAQENAVSPTADDTQWSNDFSPFKVKRKPAVTSADQAKPASVEQEKPAEDVHEEGGNAGADAQEKEIAAPKRISPHETRIPLPSQTVVGTAVSQNAPSRFNIPRSGQMPPSQMTNVAPSVPQTVQQQPAGSNFNAPRFGQTVTRGSAGGLSRPKPSPAPAASHSASTAKKKPAPSAGGFRLPEKASKEDKGKGNEKLSGIPSTGLKNQGEMRMFDDKTAKEVMNFTPEAEHFSKLSASQQKEMLKNIVDEQLKASKEEERKLKKNPFRNLNDDPYGQRR